MAISVGQEILIAGHWFDIESSEAREFLQPLRVAADAGLPGFERALEQVFAILTRPKLMVDMADVHAQEALRSLGIRLPGVSTVMKYFFYSQQGEFLTIVAAESREDADRIFKARYDVEADCFEIYSREAGFVC